MRRLWLRLTVLCFFAILCYSISIVRSQVTYEHALDPLTLSFISFDPSYTQALLEATSKRETLYYDFSHNVTAPNTTNIPPLIHFIWFHDLYAERPNATHIPSSGSNTPDLCRKYNPDYTVNIWNASAGRELVEQEYAWFLPVYDGYRYPIQRVDALKYMILHQYGGVYLDLDVSCRRALDPLLEFPAWFPRAKPLGVNNDVMAAKKAHPLMEKMIQRLKARDWFLISPWLTIFWSTGPRFVSDMLKEWLSEGHKPKAMASTEGDSANADSDGFVILPPMFYSEEYTFFGHRPGGSWYGWDVAIVVWILARPHFFLLPICVSALAVCWCRRRGAEVRTSRGPQKNIV